ncbi:hypothetical protein BDV27DRAFT_131434 [Aspergillus caelatus]|uniref:Uncharacterized protein n=1 Tax=Aspergillus caelatus TaxID=61420 RepID=A0A5N6ZZY3_9EURO|nr:uncharacterized protein BDV27DRAFT_131434 [Aspergillus caelatus]KAE8362489.1 hypothetical protein BDV27DRAFT_131434 [Aspergillus caelatus]
MHLFDSREYSACRAQTRKVLLLSSFLVEFTFIFTMLFRMWTHSFSFHWEGSTGLNDHPFKVVRCLFAL